jgi:hypothetical protein
MRNSVRTRPPPNVPRITVAAITIRTTAASHETGGVLPAEDACLSPAGVPQGVAAGAAADPGSALDRMQQNAQALATERARLLIQEHIEYADLCAKTGHSAPELTSDTFEWSCEIIDVRLTAGQLPDGRPGWLAYGTLVSRVANPIH